MKCGRPSNNYFRNQFRVDPATSLDCTHTCDSTRCLRRIFPMPVILDDFTQVLIVLYAGTEDQHYDLNQFMKILTMVIELLMRNNPALGYHMVYDLKNYSLSLIKKLTPAYLKKLQVVAMQAYPSRVRSIHFVNAPAYVDKLVTLVKMVLVPKLSKRVRLYI
ncbi:unnamed protein product, partial [Timema podura]|nr:unnamed protein product [Timema podura]